LAFGRLQQAVPVRAALVGCDLKRREREPGPAAPGLCQRGVGAEQSFGEQAAFGQPDPA
jgi:hypothetical protein